MSRKDIRKLTEYIMDINGRISEMGKRMDKLEDSESSTLRERIEKGDKFKEATEKLERVAKGFKAMTHEEHIRAHNPNGGSNGVRTCKVTGKTPKPTYTPPPQKPPVRNDNLMSMIYAMGFAKPKEEKFILDAKTGKIESIHNSELKCCGNCEYYRISTHQLFSGDKLVDTGVSHGCNINDTVEPHYNKFCGRWKPDGLSRNERCL